MEKDKIEFRLGKNLRILINERGMTVVALSRKTGVPLQTFHGWLAGVEPRSIRQIKLISRYYDLSLDDFCFNDLNTKSL
jgi:predicted transcriptional regulator